MELRRELVPKAEIVAVLVNPDSPASRLEGEYDKQIVVSACLD